MNDDILLAELAAALKANTHARPCQVCTALDQMPDSVRSTVSTALEGKIGAQTLSAILTRHGYEVGRRAILRHKQEGHPS